MYKATTVLIYLISHEALIDIYGFFLPLPILYLPCPQAFYESTNVGTGRKGKSTPRIFISSNAEKSLLPQ